MAVADIYIICYEKLMKRALSEIVRISTNDDKQVNISIVQKQSDLGLTYNKRLLILVQGYTFGYISQYKQNDDPLNIDISKCKVIVPIKNLQLDKIKRNKERIDLQFYVLENGKNVNKEWGLKFYNENLAIQWEKLFINEVEKILLRKNQKTERQNQVSPLKPLQDKFENNNENRPMPLVSKTPAKIDLNNVNNAPYREDEQKNKLKQIVKKDLQLNNKMNEVSRQERSYRNQLYQTQRESGGGGLERGNFILDSIQSRDRPENNVQRRLDFDDEAKRAAQRVRQQAQMRRREQQKERQAQLMRKQRQLAEKQRLLKQKARQFQQQQHKKPYPEQNNIPVHKIERYKIISPKSNLSQPRDFFNQTQKQTFNQQSNTSKNKSSFGKYGALVDNVIYGKNTSNELQESSIRHNRQNDKSVQLQSMHDYLFQLQKFKMNQNKLHDKSQHEEFIQQHEEGKPIPSEFGWTYRYLIKEAEGEQYEIISEFSKYCMNILKELVQQFHLPERRKKFLPKYRNEKYYLYELNDVQFKIAFINLQEVYSREELDGRDKICDQTTIKVLQNQFKSFHALYKIIKQSNARVLRPPLCCLCEYQGFVAIFKALSHHEAQGSSNLDKKVLLDLQLMSQKSKLNINALKAKQNALILKLHNEFYKELSGELGNFYTNFEYFIIQQVQGLILPDLLFTYQPIQQHDQNENSEKEHYLRQELIRNYKQSTQTTSQRILHSLDKKQSRRQNWKTGVEKVSQYILTKLTDVIKELDSLETYFLHPQQVEKKLHQNGINIRYLGLIYEHSTLNFTKSCIISEIAARVCKALFRKTIQDINLEQQDQGKDVYNQSMHYKIIDFFNCILGSSIQTATIWKVLSSHSYNYFNISLSIEQIQRGYFITSLIYNCGLEVNWNKIAINQVFESDQFFNDENFLGVKVKVKEYDPILKEKQSSLMKKIEEEDPQAFKILQNTYKIQQTKLPLKFRHKNYLNSMRKYLSNFIAPDSTSYRQQKILNFYSGTLTSPSRTQFYLKFMELKWYLRRQRKQKYILAFNNINQLITSTYGDFHPLLSELYDIMCIYHKNNGQFQDSITFAKSSVINMLKVCGSSHPKVGQCYYQMAACCLKANKKQQALVSLQKTKTIFETNKKQKDVAYAHVCLRLGLLFLSEGKVKQAENIIKFALSNFNQHAKQSYAKHIQNCQQNLYEQQRVQCYEILARCYELHQSRQQQQQLSFEAQKQIKYIKLPANLQKMMKVILYPILSSLSSSDAQVYLDIISQIPLQNNVNSYMKAYEKIYARVQQISLVENLGSYLENIKAIEKFIHENNSLKQWKGLIESYERETVNDFLSLTEEMIYFLGQGFLTGALRDNL